MNKKMTPSVKLMEPAARVCPGRPAPRFPPAGSGFILDVISHISPPLSACTVDGYTVNRQGNITRLFFKREFLVHDQNLSESDIADQLTSSVEVQTVKAILLNLAKQLKCGIDFLFSPVGFPYENSNPGKMLLISVDDIHSGRATRRFIDAAQLADHIRRYRGRSFANPKPITVATSGIECYLANDHINKGLADPFPGDMDFVLLNKEKVTAIVEFKTHNLNSSINRESCSRYQDKDWRRLDVLLQLVASLQARLFYVFWGPRHAEVKVEEISPQKEIITASVITKDAELLAGFIAAEVST